MPFSFDWYYFSVDVVACSIAHFEHQFGELTERSYQQWISVYVRLLQLGKRLCFALRWQTNESRWNNKSTAYAMCTYHILHLYAYKANKLCPSNARTPILTATINWLAKKGKSYDFDSLCLSFRVYCINSNNHFLRGSIGNVTISILMYCRLIR